MKFFQMFKKKITEAVCIHDWVQDVPSTYNPYCHGFYECSKCHVRNKSHEAPSGGTTRIPENQEKVEELARELYMKQNFPAGEDVGYPYGFSGEMWNTCNLKCRKSWYDSARRELNK